MAHFPRIFLAALVEGGVGGDAEAGPSFKRQNPTRKDANLVKSDNAGSSEK